MAVSAELIADLNAALAVVEVSLQSVPSVSGATIDFQTTLAQQIATAQQLAEQVLAAYDAALTTAGAPALFASGTPTPQMIANVSALIAAASGITVAFDCVNKLGRMALNLASIGA